MEAGLCGRVALAFAGVISQNELRIGDGNFRGLIELLDNLLNEI